MNKPYNTKRDSFNQQLLDKIIFGGSIQLNINILRRRAKEYLSRAKLANNAEFLLGVEEAITKAFAFTPKANKLRAELWSYYDILHDELFMIAAFENWAKAKLLSKRYMAHIISKPSILNRRQRVSPIHISTIRSKKYLSKLFVSHNTLSLSTLLNQAYSPVIGISPIELKALNGLKGIRNSIHFGGPSVVPFNLKTLEGLVHIKDRIYKDALNA